jgi:rRNA-processing protein FCF1
VALAKAKVESSTKSGDAWMLDSAENTAIIAITNDTELAKRLKSLNAKVFKLAKDGKLK